MDWKNVDKRQLITVLSCFVGTFLLSLIRVPALQNSTTSALGDINAYASLEDVGIFASVMALGAPWGVIAPVLGIVLGPLQFLTRWPRAWPRLHRWLGRSYIGGMLLACVAAVGLIATSPAPAAITTAFAGTALAWLLTALVAMSSIRRLPC